MTSRHAHYRHGIAGVVFGAMFASCLDPTEIELVISTDVACSDVSQFGVAVAVGAPNDDTTLASATTRDCSSDGGIGTLIVLPHGVNDAVGIRVMLGVDASVENCDVAHDFAGCVVARRSLEFIPHQPLTLPIELQSSCVGRVCTPDSTCFNGSCVDASVTCEDASCELPDSGPPPPPTTCVPVAPKVIESSAFAYTPHIAKTPSGYVVTWVGPKVPDQALFMTTLGEDGTPGSPVAIGAITASTTAEPGPLGTDGQTFATFYYNPAAQPPFSVYAGTVGGPNARTTVSGAPPVQGVLQDDAGVYESLFTYLSTTQRWGIATDAFPFALPGFTNLDLTSASAFAVARAGQTTFVSFPRSDDTTCRINACVANACVEQLSLGACTGVRLVAVSPTDWVATTAGSPLLVNTLSGNRTTSQLSALAQPATLLPVITSNGRYAIARDGKDSLLRYASPSNPLVIDTQLGYRTVAGGIGAGVDAVADDASSSPGHALVYFKSTGAGGTIPGAGAIYFTRLCQ